MNIATMLVNTGFAGFFNGSHICNWAQDKVISGKITDKNYRACHSSGVSILVEKNKGIVSKARWQLMLSK